MFSRAYHQLFRLNLRDLLNHFNSNKRDPDIALPVTSRNRILSSSSIATSESALPGKLFCADGIPLLPS